MKIDRHVSYFPGSSSSADFSDGSLGSNSIGGGGIDSSNQRRPLLSSIGAFLTSKAKDQLATSKKKRPKTEPSKKVQSIKSDYRQKMFYLKKNLIFTIGFQLSPPWLSAIGEQSLFLFSLRPKLHELGNFLQPPAHWEQCCCDDYH